MTPKNVVWLTAAYYIVFPCDSKLSAQACAMKSMFKLSIPSKLDWKRLRNEDLVKKMRSTVDEIGTLAESKDCDIQKEIIEGIEVYRTSARQRIGRKKPAPENENVIVLDAHAGAYIMGGAYQWAQINCGVAKAYGLPVYNVEYLLRPAHSMEEVHASFQNVYISLCKRYEIILSGGSAGGAMIFTMIRRLKKKAQKLPIALIANSPWIDLLQKGSSNRYNNGKDILTPYKAGYSRHISIISRGEPDTTLKEYCPLEHSLEGLPPVFLTWDSSELFASACHDLDTSLKAGGSHVLAMETKGLWHLAFASHDIVPESTEIVQETAKFIREILKYKRN